MLKRLYMLLISLMPVLCIGQMVMPDLATAVLSGSDSSALIRRLDASVLNFTRVKLNWNLTDSKGADFISIERSSNGSSFEVVGVLKVPRAVTMFEWVDDAPPKGRNYYRLTYLTKDNRHIYSKAVPAIVGQPDLRFYPNPVDNILIIRSPDPVEVQIADNTGKIRVPQTKVSGLHTLDVSSLEKGVYIIRIFNRITNSALQDKLIKN